MNIFRKKSIIGVFLFSLLLSCNSFAWYGGGWRGHGWHGGWNHGWHGGGWNRWNRVGWGVGAGLLGGALFFGAPYYYNNYNNYYTCPYARVCGMYGCYLQRTCY